MEKYCTFFCVLLGIIFLFMSLMTQWEYLVTSGICFGTAIITTETREH